MKKSKLIIATFLVILSLHSFSQVPTVTTSATTNILATSARLNGSATANTARGFVYSSTNATPTIGGAGVTQVPRGSGSGTFNASITGLTENTLYYCRAYATNANGTGYGTVQTFTTYIQASNITFDNVTETSLTLNWTRGNMTGCLVVMSENLITTTPSAANSPYYADANFGSGDDIGTNEFVIYDGTDETVDVTGLVAGTTYHVRIFEYSSAYLYATATNANNPTSLTGSPTTQATGISFSNITTTSFRVDWTRGDGANILILAKAGSAITTHPSYGSVYNAYSTYGSGSQIDGASVVYSGTAGNITIYGLTAGTTYYLQAYEYNGTTIPNYLTSSVSGNPNSQLIPKAEPTIQAHSITFSNIASNSMTVNWTRGDATNNDGCIVVAKAASAVSNAPTDGTTYTANAAFGSGGTIGTGEYVIYAGTGTSVNLTGLTSGTVYHVRVYEYNNSGTNINYLTSSATNNPNSQTTLGFCTWLGLSTDWNSTTNWSIGAVPTSSCQITIPSSVSNMPILGAGTGNTNTITIESGANLTVSNSATLTSLSHVTIESGASLQILGNSCTVSIGGNLTLESSGGSGACGQLVITGSSSFSVSGTSTLTKTVTSNRFYLMTCPITSPDINDFTGHYVYKWLEGSKTWDNTLNTSSSVAVMEGLNVKQESGDPTSFVFSGTFNNGTLSRTVTNGNTGDNDNGWNLIGNPYPSAIDLEATGLNLNNAGPTFYFYPGSTSWGTYNTLTNASNNGGSQYIPAMQGFFIFSDVTSGSVGFANSMRVANSQSYWKNATIEHPTVKIAIETTDHKTEATVVFYPEGTPEFDSEFDALIFPGSSSSDEFAQIALITPSNTKLAVNTYDPSMLTGEVNLEIPIELKTVRNENITFSSPLIERIPESVNVYLVDKQENTYTNLRISNYSYVLPPSTVSDRFSLVLSSVALKVNERQLPTFRIYSYQKQITVRNESQNNDKTKINIYNISGGKILSESIQSLSSKTYNITQSGVYIVQIINSSGTITKKVIIE